MSNETIQAYEKKIAGYERLISKIKSLPTDVYKIKAGPFKKASGLFYRVEKGGADQVITIVPNLEGESLKTNDEVLVIEGCIIEILPKELKMVIELPKVKLANWNDIGGSKEQIESIKSTVDLSIKENKLAKEFGLEALKGILLYGPPGCGKTLIAKAIASDITGGIEVDRRAFTYIKGAELLDKYVGETERKIGEMFKEARAYTKETGKRAILFFDEADAIMPSRHNGFGISSTVVPTFLSEMDGLETDTPFIILSTNIPETLDEAIIREGRIDLKIEINRPSAEESVEIFNIHLGKIKCHEDVQKLSKKAIEIIFSTDLKKKISGALLGTLATLAGKSAITRLLSQPSSPKGIIEIDIEKALREINHKKL